MHLCVNPWLLIYPFMHPPHTPLCTSSCPVCILPMQPSTHHSMHTCVHPSTYLPYSPQCTPLCTSICLSTSLPYTHLHTPQCITPYTPLSTTLNITLHTPSCPFLYSSEHPSMPTPVTHLYSPLHTSLCTCLANDHHHHHQ